LEINDGELGAYFDDCARRAFMDSFSPEEEERLTELFTAWDIGPGCRVLEPGCGSGRLTVRLAAAVGPGGMVYACDLSEEMMRRARARELPGNVRFACASAETIQADDGYFDRAICFHVFPHFSDQKRTLREFHRVLKPGGSLRVTHFRDRGTINRRHSVMTAPLIAHAIPDEDGMRSLLSGTGFTVIEIADSEEAGYRVHAVK